MLNVISAVVGMVVSAVAAPILGASNVSPVISAPPTDRIVIDLVTVNGAGCPPGSAAVAATPDNTAMTVTYSSYLAQVGVGARPTDFRKNCQINLIVHVPQGFTYAIAKADFRGFGSLAAGATATERANYYFTGTSTTPYREHPFTGPMSNTWHTTDATEIADLVWAPCGSLKNFNINTELLVHAGTSNPGTTTSFISMDSTDAAVDTLYHFAWKQC
jgi:hypothetical protein